MYTNVGDLAKNRHNKDYLKYKERKQDKKDPSIVDRLRLKGLRYDLVTALYSFNPTEKVIFNIFSCFAYSLPYYYILSLTLGRYCIFCIVCFINSWCVEIRSLLSTIKACNILDRSTFHILLW